MDSYRLSNRFSDMPPSAWQVFLLLLCSGQACGWEGARDRPLAEQHRITNVLDNAAHRLAQSCCNTILGSSKSDR